MGLVHSVRPVLRLEAEGLPGSVGRSVFSVFFREVSTEISAPSFSFSILSP